MGVGVLDLDRAATPLRYKDDAVLVDVQHGVSDGEREVEADVFAPGWNVAHETAPPAPRAGAGPKNAESILEVTLRRIDLQPHARSEVRGDGNDDYFGTLGINSAAHGFRSAVDMLSILSSPVSERDASAGG
jgi:hypothetical protein